MSPEIPASPLRLQRWRQKIYEDDMNTEPDQQPDDSGNPKFGRLLIVLFLAVVFVGFLTWIMEAFFPDFG